MAKAREDGGAAVAVEPELAAAVARQLRADHEAREREEALAHERWKGWAGLGAADKTRREARIRYKADWGELPHWACSVVMFDADGREKAPLKEWPEAELPAHSPEEARGRYMALCGIRNFLTGPTGAPQIVARPAPATAPPTVEA